ncbi:hypothetical protein PINS_up001404 [Pythium insidiosum]|nr:hypothetical protein PINS_up001404 [Pythium insidiosum]
MRKTLLLLLRCRAPRAAPRRRAAMSSLQASPLTPQRSRVVGYAPQNSVQPRPLNGVVDVRLMSSASAVMESMEELLEHAVAGKRMPLGDATQDSVSSEDVESPRFAFVHPTAVVHPLASLGQDVHVGPYCIIGPDVSLEDGVVLQSHVVVDGRTRIGRGTRVHPFACLGGDPQDKKHQRSSPCRGDWQLIIGAHCVIREHVTIHGCTSYSSHSPTTIGDHCWILCGAHVGHDVRIGQRVVLSNNVCVAGHVEIGDCAIIGGQVGLKQHIKVGGLAMVGGGSAVDADVLPYGLVSGNRAKLLGLNLVGLRRAGVPRDEIKLMLRVVRYLFGMGTSSTAAVCPKTGFAPALDLPYHNAVCQRVEEVKRHLAELNVTKSSHPLLHEMIGFVLPSPSRPRSSLCVSAIR